MAKMIDKKPSYKGEGLVWDKLHDYLPDDIIVYNQREVNGREYDFCIMSENLGFIVIEVKGWISEKISVNGVDDIIVEGYEKPQFSPKKQARAYRFAILNCINEKYNLSPLVLDMVCYPFISEVEYRNCHLDIISEKDYTIFKEDLENRELLNNKIINVFQINSAIPHSDFSYDLMLRIRRSLEPDLEETMLENKVLPYSKLKIYPNAPKMDEIRKMIDHYFEGVKSIMFVGDAESYENVLGVLANELQRHNIDFEGNNLCISYRNGVPAEHSNECFRIFNFELYFVKNLDTICPETLCIREGNITSKDRILLERLSQCTMFNIQQYEVEHATTEKDILVEAGAGTGKTFSMVSRVAFLCNKENDSVSSMAEEIAMVTFTNDAAINMKRRLKQMFINYFVLTGKEKYLRFVEDIDRSRISTIHKFAIGIMRGESLYTGLGTNFRISENEYKRGKAYDVFLEEFLEEKERENPNFVNELPVPIYDLKRKLMKMADRLFDKSINPGLIKKSEMGVTLENNIPYFNELIAAVVFPAEALYLENLKAGNDLDLKESLIGLEKILTNGCEKLEELRLRYLFIDEFQDTDDVQIEIFQKLQKSINADCKLFVVGDLKQSIYRFRGTKLNAFQKLQNGKKNDWSHYRLNRNYRTDRRLLSMYDKIFEKMGKNKILPYFGGADRLISDVISDAAEGELLVELPCHGKESGKLLELLNATISSEVVKVQELMKTKTLSKEERTIAILVRSNWQIKNIVEAAAKEGIHIETSAGGDLFQLPSTLDFYKLILAIHHSTSPVHLVNFIESNYTNMKLDYQRLRNASEGEKLNELTSALNVFFKERMNISWKSVLNEVYTQPVLYILKKIIDALRPWDCYTNIFSEKRLYIANLEYLIEKMIKFAHIDSLTLNQIAEYLGINILTGQRQLSRTREVDDNGVHVLCTTVHKSKGLEYGTVILPYTSEDISDIKRVKLEAYYNNKRFSYTVLFDNGIREKNSNYSEDKEVHEQIAEEARILYVALTRAIRNCIWINNIDCVPDISWGTLLEG